MSKKAKKYIESAQAAMIKKNYTKAVKNFKAYLEIVPSDKKVLYTLADAYAYCNDTSTAIKLYIQVAEHLQKQHFLMKSIAVCKRILNIDPDNSRAKYLLEVLHKDKSDEDQSTQEFLRKSIAKKLEEAEKEKGDVEASAQPSMGVSSKSAVAESAHAADEVSSLPDGELTVSEDDLPKMAPPREAHLSAKDVQSEISMNAEASGDKDLAVLEEIQKASGAAEFVFKDGELVMVSQEPIKLVEPAAQSPEVPVEQAKASPAELSAQMESKIPAPELQVPQTPARPPSRSQHLSASDFLFEELDKDEYMKIIDRMDIRAFGPGEMIVKEGDPGDSMFIICSGDVNIFTYDKVGKRIFLANLDEGEFFGEMALLSGKPRTASIISNLTTELLELKSSDLPEIELYCPNIVPKLEKFYEKRKRATIETLIEKQY